MSSRRRIRAAAVALAAPLLLAACASGAAPEPMTQAEFDAFADAFDKSSMDVGDAIALAPADTVGMIDARVAAGVGQVQETVLGAPPSEFHDWAVLGMCFYADAVPSIEVAAVPPEDREAAEAAPGFHLVCDGPPGE